MMPCQLDAEVQAALFDETLRTVGAQTCSDYEVVLVDDGLPVPAGGASVEGLLPPGAGRDAPPPLQRQLVPEWGAHARCSASSSRRGERMLHSIRAVDARQWPLVRGDAVAEAAYHRGLELLTDIFLDCLVENVEDRLRDGDPGATLRSARLLMAASPSRWLALLQRLELGTDADWVAYPGSRSMTRIIATVLPLFLLFSGMPLAHVHTSFFL